MWAMILKEFRQLRRDRRTLAMMIVLPVLLLVVLGYAASFNVSSIPVAVAGPAAAAVKLPAPFTVVSSDPAAGRTWAQDQLRDGHAAVAVITDRAGRPAVLIDGSQLFTAQATVSALAKLAAPRPSAQALPSPTVTILYNPALSTSDVMIPGLAGVVLVFVGTIITSLGVVRERQSGTLEQLAVMPLRPRDVFLGKILPYFAVAVFDLAIVLGIGIAVFGVPFRGSPLVFALGALLFVFVTLGIGVLISTVSQNQGQAIQLAVMTMLPQVLLSGLIFPLSSIAAGVRWIAYLLPLTYFNEISRGVMLRAEPIGPLWQPFAFLAVLGLIIVSLAILRFRSDLAPASAHRRRLARRKGRGDHGADGRARACRQSRRQRRCGGRTGSGAADMTAGTGAAGGPEPGWGASALRLSYGDVLALDDVSVGVVPGQITAVVGGDGAGKTSLLRCLAGALLPASGEVRSPGKSRIGFLPASSGIYPDLTVAENLDFRAAAYGLTRDAAGRRAGELLDRAGLAAARDRLAGQLSGGMRQKLGVIAALLHRPDLLILDEPSTGVDPVSRSGLWWLIASAAADGAAVILATTYLDDAQRAAAVLVLAAGRELASGTPEQIVAGLPGTVRALDAPPGGSARQRAWRRGAGWRLWCPPGSAAGDPGVPGDPSDPGAPAEPDLQDAVTVAALAHETGVKENGEPGPRGQNLRARDRRAHEPPGPLAESVGVTCRFGSFTAVRDVSMQVMPGEIVGLLGANGAGKTTLIRMLLGLIPATAGQVRLLGEPPSRGTRRRIGYVPQGLGLYDDLTAAQNMAFTAAVFGGSAGVLPAGTGGRSALPVGQLPLGLQRRVAFAAALAHEPELLILDEPTSGVDPLGRARLWQTIAATAEAGAGVLVSTHYMEEAGECDRLIIMADGVVVATGTVPQIIGEAEVTVVETPDWAAALRPAGASGTAGGACRPGAAGAGSQRGRGAPGTA